MARVAFTISYIGFDSEGLKADEAYLAKQVEMAFAPFLDMEIEDPAWPWPQKVRSVTFSTAKSEFSASLGTKEIRGVDKFQQAVEACRAAGWSPVAD